METWHCRLRSFCSVVLSAVTGSCGQVCLETSILGSALQLSLEEAPSCSECYSPGARVVRLWALRLLWPSWLQ